ncbi:MAG: proline dehydrogenase family protein [Chloroherpetonaceae bacterium]|nr:proline dehydrogenase family protein [Chloroherpetonaceae bacterium]
MAELPASLPSCIASETAAPAQRIVHFEDTRLAFAHRSDRELWRMRWLFRIMNHPTLNKIGTSTLQLALRLHLPIEPVIKATLFRQFCGGETVEACQSVIQALWQAKIKAILDYAVEGERSEKGFERTANTVVQNIWRASGNPMLPFAVFKVTGLARMALLEKISAQEPLTLEERSEWQRVQDRIERIAAAARTANVPVMIDAEESWIQPAIDELALQAMRQSNRQRAIFFTTLQLYRHDRLAYLKALFEQATAEHFDLGVKLVRGAYMEKERERAARLGYPSPIHSTKADTDRDYDAAIDFCLQHLDRIALCAGTHNEKSTLKLANALPSPDMPTVYFAQLYGMGDHLSYTLAANGFNVAKYVPYGAVREVLPYLIRRAEENSSLKGYVSRELGLIEAEWRRRRKRL